jgi:hypothetical protein
MDIRYDIASEPALVFPEWIWNAYVFSETRQRRAYITTAEAKDFLPAQIL